MANDTQDRSNGSIVIDKITSIHYFEFDDSFIDHPETHEAWEMVFVDRGECNIVANEKTIRLKQGEIYFHKPGQNHLLELIDGVAPNIFIISFLSSSDAMAYFEDRKLTASMSTKQHISAILHEASSTYDLPFNKPRMNEMRFKEGALWGGEQTIKLRLELMLIEMVRQNHYYDKKPKMFFPKEIITDEFALKVIGFMEDRLYGKFTIEELSRTMSFSKTYVSQYFVKITGYSIIDYFNMMKVNEAKRLIRESGRNFCEISEMLMFSNSHYFSTTFKRYTGMTPTQYKRSCKID